MIAKQYLQVLLTNIFLRVLPFEVVVWKISGFAGKTWIYLNWMFKLRFLSTWNKCKSAPKKIVMNKKIDLRACIAKYKRDITYTLRPSLRNESGTLPLNKLPVKKLQNDVQTSLYTQIKENRTMTIYILTWTSAVSSWSYPEFARLICWRIDHYMKQ